MTQYVKELLFITSNHNKVKEVNQILKNKFKVLSLKDIEFEEEIPEPYDTIRANAIHKALYFYDKTSQNCISEDSGLEVTSLNNAPGAYSARYAGDQRSDSDNNNKIINELNGVDERSCRYVSVFCIIIDGVEYVFEGEVKGKIANEPSGYNGFGYDPLFIPDGYSETFGVLSQEVKNSISHRKNALDKVGEFLDSF